MSSYYQMMGHEVVARQWTNWMLAAGGGIVIAHFFWGYIDYRINSILPRLKRLVPGMDICEVRNIFPLRFIATDFHGVELIHYGTTLVASDAQPVFCLAVCARGTMIRPPEVAELYFNSKKRLVGIRYSSDSGRWKPSWPINAEGHQGTGN